MEELSFLLVQVYVSIFNTLIMRNFIISFLFLGSLTVYRFFTGKEIHNPLRRRILYGCLYGK